MRYFLKSEKTSGEFQERTEEIEPPILSADGMYFSVTFTGNPSQSYQYKATNVAAVNETPYPIEKDKIFSFGERKFSGPMDAVLLTSDNETFTPTIEISHNGKKYSCDASRLTILEKSCDRDLFRYLQSVAKAIESIEESANCCKDYLSKQFTRLEGDTLAESAAAFFTDDPVAPVDTIDTEPIIYPFSSNLSQMNAVEAAFAHGLSVIEGPPGTGKTQTILNILANLVIRDKTALITSPNNSATANVVEKLERSGFGFLVAALGKKENIDKFLVHQNEKAYPAQLADWERTETELAALRERIREHTSLLRRVYEVDQELAREKMRLESLEAEFALFPMNKAERLHCSQHASLEHLFAVRDAVATRGASDRRVPFFQRLQFVFIWGIGRWKDYDTLSAALELSIDALILQKARVAANKQVNLLEQWLEEHDRTALAESVTADSEELFCGLLYKKYRTRLDAGRKAFDNPWREPAAFRAEYPIITSTTNAARNQMGQTEEPFDYVIIDESSQADVVTGFLALSAAKHGVVVGDVKQIPCVITPKAKAQAQTIPLSPALFYFDYTEYNLLSSLKKQLEDGRLAIPCTLLKEHYRCHPDIIGFCNEEFYGGELLIMTENPKGSERPALVCLMSPEGNHDRETDYNRVQAQMFVQECLPRLEASYDASEIGVAAPYNRQTAPMRKLDEIPPEVEIKTVHKYQGREKDAIAFITTINQLNSFVDNAQLVNVAISRAKDEFWLIVSPEICKGAGIIPDLKRYMTYHNGEMVHSHVLPAFPFLYPNHTSERVGYLHQRNASEKDQYSEVQFEEHLLEVLDKLDLREHIGYCRNYLLKLLVADPSAFTQDEREFIRRPSHADFVLFRTIDHAPILEIEVNGDQHDTDSKQIRRDATKQSIFEKMHIPQLVVRTNEERGALLKSLETALRDALAYGDAHRSNAFMNTSSVASVVLSSPDSPWKKDASDN